jgi:serine O-acetyltransferase
MLVQLILSDLYRYCGNTKFSSFIKNYFFNRGFNFSFWLRLAGSKSIIAKFAYPIFYYKKKKYGIDIHCTTKIGYGLYISHGGPCGQSNYDYWQQRQSFTIHDHW